MRGREAPPPLGNRPRAARTQPTRPVQLLPTMSRLNAVVAAVFLLALPACTAIIPIDVTRDVDLLSPVGAFDTAKVVDLTTEADLWSHRNEVDSVSVDDITVTVVSVAADHQATSATLRLAFRPAGAADAGQDLQVGAFDRLAFVPGAVVTLHGSAALEAFLDGVLHGSGQFTALASGTVDGQADAVLRIGLKGSLAYKVAGQ